ncbi:D-alanyl-D-alanine carboxypeptidase [Candidatus Daviesbacteria bacterium]|nr:D-alanyl-D-alanine carboxypeptidase [Candidatus Daviesbacteria bacterium]
MKVLSVLFYLSSFFIIFTTVYLYIFPANSEFKLVSPVREKAVIPGINQWFPKEVLGAQVAEPKVSAKASFFVETGSSEVLYTKNIHEQLPIASLAKVMTVLIALEHKSLENLYTVSTSAASAEPDKMFLIRDEKLSLKELLYGIFLISANDAAEVIAEGTLEGGREEFIQEMNRKAGQLGMKNTRFVNPTGLDEDEGGSYSSTYDLVLLTRHLIKRYPEVVNISNIDHINLAKTENHQDYDMYSGINLLTTYPGVVGFKTGFTPQAGYTLITLARKDGKEVVGVILDSQYRRDEAKELLDYSFSKLDIRNRK